MSLEAIGLDSARHFAAGLALTIFDHISYRSNNDKESRMATKAECLKSMEAILGSVDFEPGREFSNEALSAQSTDTAFAAHVETVKCFLYDYGWMKFQFPFFKKITEWCKGFLSREKINNLPLTQKYTACWGFELIGDLYVGVMYFNQVEGSNPIAALGASIYQAHALFLGLITGKVFTSALNWFLTTREERDLDVTLKELLHKTPLVDILLNYKPAEEVHGESSSLGKYGVKVVGAGKRLVSGVSKAAGDLAEKASDVVSDLAHKDEKRKDESKEKLKDMTEGY